MCLNSPDIPDPTPPPQDAKAPDAMAQRKNARKNATSTSTVLTGPSGVQPGLANTGGNTLLGG